IARRCERADGRAPGGEADLSPQPPHAHRFAAHPEDGPITIDIDPATCYFDDMVFLLKSLLIVFTAVAVFAPAVFVDGCEDDPASDCEEICVCVCHGVAAKPDAADGIVTIPLETASARPDEEDSRGTMLPAEIFRPPLCA
ncbi:MAG: hypothetical protein PHW08_10245, partial [Kiritimatiellae bacterium]|nr:hypothetical protein [Kiritimatiellia bacterium]